MRTGGGFFPLLRDSSSNFTKVEIILGFEMVTPFPITFTVSSHFACSRCDGVQKVCDIIYADRKPSESNTIYNNRILELYLRTQSSIEWSGRKRNEARSATSSTDCLRL